MGHTNFNMLLKYVPPLVVTLALNLEPALGSLAGWAVGVAAAPGPWTAVGGVAMLLATMVVSSAAAAREVSVSDNNSFDSSGGSTHVPRCIVFR